LLLLVSLTFARPVLLGPPEKVETVADGLSFSRPGDFFEGEYPANPDGDSEAAYQSWIRSTERYKDRRADMVALDRVLAQLAPSVAACALARGETVGATGVFTVSSSTAAGQLTVKVAAGASAGLSACFSETVDEVYPPMAHHPVGGSLPPLKADYTVTFTGAPVEVAEGLDRFSGVAGAAFGSAPSSLVEGSRGSSHRNASHYTRAFDDNVRFMGVPCVLIFSYHDEDGLYGYRARVTGDSHAFALRDRVKRAAGDGQWDNKLKGWYWRTATQAWVIQRSADGLSDELTVLHVERARAGGMVTYMPGDDDASRPANTRLLPKVLRERLSAPAEGAPVEAAPVEAAPVEAAPTP
jgi:hypothetical protein